MPKPYFQPVSAKVSFPQIEEEVLGYWKENKIFEKSISSRPEKKTWTFLDGPPFVTGLPHYGTLLSSIPKDLFPRYWTMKGYRVRRVWGWDCHGLPAENKVEEKLEIKRKKDIEEKIGIKKFIDECKVYVNNVSVEWEWYVEHIGRWVDFKHAYRTMDLPYMETVMWVFSQIYKKGYIYKGLRVSLYCPHCATPISNFEVAMDPDNYKLMTEATAVFKYQSADEKNTFFLAWSTTPWNKLATPALAVNPDLTYVKVKQGEEFYILAKGTMKMLRDDKPVKVVEEFKGKALVNKRFVPHYDFYAVEPGKRAFVIIPGDFVTAEEGTGIVTIAAYGEEDLAVMLKENIQLVLHIDDEGVLKPAVPKWAGMYYLDVDPLVVKDLQERGLIYRVDSYSHTVPVCWRCQTRLIYVPQDAWYIDIQKLKSRLYKNNEPVNWFPAHFKDGRFRKSIETAPDWCISRSRYWGSPVPVWECASGHRNVPGSLAELEAWSGQKVEDLHKPVIDELVVKCQTCGKEARRVKEVLDSWIEAGSASFAERHWPLDPSASSVRQGSPQAGQVKLEDFFPPDFIVEYTGQIRAWFYVLHVIATALYDSQAFKNVVVSGVILGTDGRKMSKNFHNYPDPKEMLNKYGGDALRLYLMGSPVMHGEDIRISETEYRNQVKGLLLKLWNIYNFFLTYAGADGWGSKKVVSCQLSVVSENILDQWIILLLNKLIDEVTKAFENYDTVAAVKAYELFVEEMSTWYIRRSRDRIGPAAADSQDKQSFYETCHLVLTIFCRLASPCIPFLTEAIYRNLTGEESVHLQEWPDKMSNVKCQMSNMEEKMKIVRQICELGHAQRKAKGIKVRQPLQKFIVHSSKFIVEDNFLQLIKDELNVKEVEIKTGKGELSVALDTELTPDLLEEGQARELVRQIQQLRKEKGCKIDERMNLVLPSEVKSWPPDLLNYLKRETLTKTVSWGKTLSLTTG